MDLYEKTVLAPDKGWVGLTYWETFPQFLCSAKLFSAIIQMSF